MRSVTALCSRRMDIVGLFALFCLAGAAQAQLCPPGYYNPSGGLAAGDIACPAGYYTFTSGALFPTACSAGYYQPMSAQSSQIPAQAGYYVPSAASSSEFPAPAGTYASGSANISPTSCIPGYYTPSAGSQFPIAASAGYFVPNGSAISQIPAIPGYYVPSSASSFQTAASVGFYVHFPASSTQTPDPNGTTTPHTASTSPRSSSPSSPRGSNFIVGPIYTGTPTPTIDLTGGPSALHVKNASTDLGTADTLTALTLISAALSGPEQADFQISGFVPGTVLYEQGATDIDLSVVNPGSLSPGLYSATMTVQTDQSAPYGSAGDSFAYTVTYNAVPEPASLAAMGGALLAFLRRSRRVTQ